MGKYISVTTLLQTSVDIFNFIYFLRILCIYAFFSFLSLFSDILNNVCKFQSKGMKIKEIRFFDPVFHEVWNIYPDCTVGSASNPKMCMIVAQWAFSRELPSYGMRCVSMNIFIFIYYPMIKKCLEFILCDSCHCLRQDILDMLLCSRPTAAQPGLR